MNRRGGFVLAAIAVVSLVALGIFFERDRLVLRGGRSPSEGGQRASGAAAVAVAVETAKAGSLPILRHTIGSVVPIASTALSSPASGIVASVAVGDGALVKAGDVVVQLDARAIEATVAKDEGVLARDQATLDDANATQARTLDLVRQNAVSKQAADDALAAVREAEATIEVDRAQLAADNVALDYTKILAPFEGKLSALAVSPGAFLAPGTPVANLTQMKPVYAEFSLPESDLELARAALAGGTLEVGVAPVLASGSTARLAGPIVFIDNAIDPATATFKLRARLANEDGALWPGRSLDVEVNAGDRDGLVIVPGVAVQPGDSGSICFVVKADGTVEMRKVTVALRDGDLAGISDGLKAGEIVVTEGQMSLTDGARVRVQDASGSKTPGTGAPTPASAGTAAPEASAGGPEPGARAVGE